MTFSVRAGGGAIASGRACNRSPVQWLYNRVPDFVPTGWMRGPSPRTLALLMVVLALGLGASCQCGGTPPLVPEEDAGESPDAGGPPDGGGTFEDAGEDAGALDGGALEGPDAATITGIEVTPALLTLAAGEKGVFLAELVRLDGVREPVPAGAATWSVQPPEAADLDGGVVMGRTPGAATVTASAQGFLGTAALEVLPARPVAGLYVEPADAGIDQGFTQTFQAFADYSDGVRRLVSSAVWSTDDAGVATVDEITGVAQGESPGVATIRADGEGLSGEGLLWVRATPPAPGEVGAACPTCAAGLVCVSGPEWPQGYCTRDCTQDRACPAGSSCYPVGGQGATLYCVRNCAPATDGGLSQSSCRLGYCCFEDPGSGAGGCFASGGATCP